MTRIVRYDKACAILDEDDQELFKKLDSHLSYEVLGAEHSKAFKGYINDRGEEVTWDGRKHLMSCTGRFPPGLLDRVLRFYEVREKQVEVIDRRSPKTDSNPIDIMPTLQGMKKILRPYQVQAVQTAKAQDRGIIKICTGGGKSLVATSLIAELGKKAIVFVIGKDLLYQMHGLFESVFGKDAKIGIIGDGKCEIGDINVATIWSVGQALGMKKGKVSLDDEDVEEKKIDPAKFRAIKEMLL